MNNYLPIGEVSSGTLRSEDVVPDLFGLASEVKMSRDDRNRVRALSAEWRAIERGKRWEDRADEGRVEVWNDLSDILDAYAPPYCYVGALDGDGACIGVWISDEALDTARLDGEVTEGDDPEKDGAEYRLVVSDHGNRTLYDLKDREVWAVV